MMKRIGLYTIQDFNYGNRLQNYATQFFLEKNGYEVHSFITRAQGKFVKEVFNTDSKYNQYLRLKYFFRQIFKRDYCNNFFVFNKKIKYTKDLISKDRIDIKNRYDCIIAGADQIWNTTFNSQSVNSFFPFNHNCKISFSSSFGVDSIPYDESIVKCLNDFKALSVREEAGANIIKELTGRNATVLVDPTMLLTVAEWRKIEKRPKVAKERYILTCFLSPKCNDAINKLEEVRDNRIIYELHNPDDRAVRNAGPSEFLWLIDHADLVLTDSFHACVFSFLFNKPFIVYDRNWNEGNMNSRLETLLTKFKIERKYAGSGLTNDIWEHDYEEGYRQLDAEREKAISFLKSALND